MMQIGSTIQSHKSLFYQARRSSFNCNGSPLNPTARSSYSQTIRASATASNELTLKTISNLDKLLQKKIPSNSPDSIVIRGESGNELPENKGKGLLGGLNLARLWPEMKAAEEMSPRQLNNLKRLLSKSRIEYSPRNSLAHRWKEYHGSNDWYGMLDPLDENLRREMVRYGEFIQAAYHCFHSDPATSSNEAPAYRHVALPDRSYKVTKSLYATSSVGLPKWVDDVAPDLGWMTQRTSCVGYVAVCDDQKEISRMGRRDIVIALRGTATCLEWAENMRDLLVQVPGEYDSNNGQPKVECGFLNLHKTAGAHVPSLSESVVTEIQRLMEMYKGETLSITVTGHSLGAALALLVANDLSTCTPNMPPVAVFSFGGPRVGNRGFVNCLNTKNVKVLRIVNSQDVITKVPGMFVSEDLDRKLRDSCPAEVLSMLDNNMPWAYAHAGTELKVDTKNSPFLKSNADVACCHDLEAYLHLVDGFLDSKCPFRSNTKRSLLKLLHEQNANVKKLYTNKANGLRLNLERDMQMPSNVLPSPSS